MNVPDLREDVIAIYRRNPVGCCLHIVLDDNNIRDSDVEFCLRQAVDEGHELCERVARNLLQMSKTQRLKVSKSWKGERCGTSS